MNTEAAISIIAASSLLSTAAVFDIRFRRIPNWLNGSALVLGVIFHLCLNGIEGLGWSLFGCGTGLAVLLVPYCLRAMGAGDVKLMMALGAWIGATAVLFAFVYTAILGGLIGLWMMYRAGQLDGFIVRIYMMANEGISEATTLRVESSACQPMPYGAVIALGYCTHMFAVPAVVMAL